MAQETWSIQDYKFNPSTLKATKRTQDDALTSAGSEGISSGQVGWVAAAVEGGGPAGGGGPRGTCAAGTCASPPWPCASAGSCLKCPLLTLSISCSAGFPAHHGRHRHQQRQRAGRGRQRQAQRQGTQQWRTQAAPRQPRTLCLPGRGLRHQPGMRQALLPPAAHLRCEDSWRLAELGLPLSPAARDGKAL